MQNLKNEFQRYSFSQKTHLMEKEIDILKNLYKAKLLSILKGNELETSSLFEKLKFTYRQNITRKEQALDGIKESFLSKNPTIGLNESYAQVVKNDKKIKPERLKPDDIFELQTEKIVITSKVLNIENL